MKRYIFTQSETLDMVMVVSRGSGRGTTRTVVG